MPAKSNRVIVTVIGADTLDISARVSALLAEIGLEINARHEGVFKFTHRA